MPIAVFENRDSGPLFLTVEPAGHRYEVPPLAKIGIRYVLEDGDEARSFTGIRKDKIDFWCNSPDHEVDIVYPEPYDRLIWDLCVGQGWCGGVVAGKASHIDLLMPASGIVTAEEFAELAIRAETEAEHVPDALLRWQERLARLFVEHIGASSAPAATLRYNLRRPFDVPENG
jgi:hypothetical protein